MSGYLADHAEYPGIFMPETEQELRKMYFNKNMKNNSFLTVYLCYNQAYVCKKAETKENERTKVK